MLLVLTILLISLERNITHLKQKNTIDQYNDREYIYIRILFGVKSHNGQRYNVWNITK